MQWRRRANPESGNTRGDPRPPAATPPAATAGDPRPPGSVAASPAPLRRYDMARRDPPPPAATPPAPAATDPRAAGSVAASPTASLRRSPPRAAPPPPVTPRDPRARGCVAAATPSGSGRYDTPPAVTSPAAISRDPPTPGSGSSRRSPPPTFLANFSPGSCSQSPSAQSSFSVGSLSIQFLENRTVAVETGDVIYPSSSTAGKGTYNLLGASMPPKEDLYCGTSMVSEVISMGSLPAPSTPTHEKEKETTRSRRSCRNKQQQKRNSLSPKASSSASTSKWSKHGPLADTLWAETNLVKQRKIEFIAYLNQFCGEVADQMWVEKSYTFRIDYNHLKHTNKKLAYFICNNYKRFRSVLEAVVKDFLLRKFRHKENDGRFIESFTLDDHIRQLTRLSFTEMPNSIFSLEDFISKNKTTLSWLFEGHHYCRYQIAVISPAVRRVIQKLIEYITNAHRDGKTWNGQWTLADWEVIDGLAVHLCREPVVLANRAMCRQDLDSVSTQVIPKLSHTGEEGGRYPAYVAHLSAELRMKDTDDMPDSDYFGWFYRYLTFHPALMSSRARSALVRGFYYAAVRMNYNSEEYFDVVFDDDNVGEWQQFVFRDRSTIHDVLWKVYWDGNEPDPNSKPESWELMYSNTAGCHLIYMRHILEHANKYTFWMGFQMLESSTEPELLAAEEFSEFLPEFIKLILQSDKLEDELLEAWDFYTGSTYKGQ